MRYKYEILAASGRAKSAHMETVHGTIETPVFMNVGTAAAIKGGLSSDDLLEIETQVLLCNTYHLHVRTGEGTVRALGGLRHFARWYRPTLTDSGGFQVYSLADTGRKIKEEGVYFRSHIDGRKILMGPEESIRIQYNLGSTIAMAFDECPPALAEREYILPSVQRTSRWLLRCMEEMRRCREEDAAGPNPQQLLFGINQGGILEDVRVAQAEEIGSWDLDGYAVGGLAVGESHEEMYRILDVVVPHLPRQKPTYLMGVGTPANIVEAVDRGVDFFDCVYPSRNGRHGHVYTHHGRLNLTNQIHALEDGPIEEGCQCPACAGRRLPNGERIGGYSRAYIRHLLKAGEMLGMRLCVLHNLYFYNHLMQEIRDAIRGGRWESWKAETLWGLQGRQDG